MRVFISYAHTDIDKELAQFIARRLTAARIDLWMDEQSMHGGQRVQKTIETAAASCSHAVLLVSRSWLERDWTNWELGLFDGRTPPATLVPIWRRDRKHLKLPPQLYQFAGFEWPEVERDRDARFWQLRCALMDEPPGPPETWGVRGRDTGTATAEAFVPRPPVPPALMRPSLKCDRQPQWTAVDDLASSGNNELFLVPGLAGQGHDHFEERIERLLRADPPRQILRVDWGHHRRPASRDEFRAAVGSALDATPSELEMALRDRLAYQNVILLHDCVRSRFLDDTLIAYYTSWLPEWLAAAGGRMQVKCVQPIEWPRESLGASALRWFGVRGAPDGNRRSDADMMLRRMLEESGSLLRAVRLRELHDVSRQDLDEFCELVVGLKPRQTAWLRQRIDERQARTTSALFQAIDDFIPEVPDERSMQ